MNGHQIARGHLRNSKVRLSSLKIFSQPREGEDIFLYLGVPDSMVSVVLVREEKGVHRPIYFSSYAFNNSKTRYLNGEDDPYFGEHFQKT